ncbi:MAG TPA: tyrosine-type recombinase/integrase [Symbiobacteriaceae bacterium]|jgi:integrase/recombinase XerC|nr:tyrosine-type recombinase/integrase [Symbiobacteriaceae bacterium]
MAAAADAGGLSPEVAGFLASLRVEKAASEHTLRSYQLDLEQFLSWLATGGEPVSPGARPNVTHDDLAAVTPLTVREYLACLQRQTFARRTLARKLSSLRSFFRYLCRTGNLPANPALGVPAPKPEKSPPAILREDEMSSLLSMPDPATLLGQRDKALLELLYATGMRVSELVGLNCGQLDLQEGWVSILGPGLHERMVPVGGQALAALAQYLAGARPELALRAGDQAPFERQPLFLNKAGTRLTDRSVRRILDGYLARMSLAGSSPHTIRQTCAAHMLSHGAELAVVQVMLGHGSVATTQQYAPARESMLRSTYRNLHPRERKARRLPAQVAATCLSDS